jgi:hypothetical protein
MEVTREQLSAAFARPSVRIAIDRLSARDGDDYTEGHVRYPQVAADMIISALKETGPWADDRDVVDAHVCCEHAGTDREISAMAALLPALPLVSKLCYDARERVMDWAKRRACDGLPPF